MPLETADGLWAYDSLTWMKSELKMSQLYSSCTCCASANFTWTLTRRLRPPSLQVPNRGRVWVLLVCRRLDNFWIQTTLPLLSNCSIWHPLTPYTMQPRLRARILSHDCVLLTLLGASGSSILPDRFYQSPTCSSLPVTHQEDVRFDNFFQICVLWLIQFFQTRK